MRLRKGNIHEEYTSAGRKSFKTRKRRYVATITVNRVRYHFHTTNLQNAEKWLKEKKAQIHRLEKAKLYFTVRYMSNWDTINDDFLKTKRLVDSRHLSTAMREIAGQERIRTSLLESIHDDNFRLTPKYIPEDNVLRTKSTKLEGKKIRTYLCESGCMASSKGYYLTAEIPYFDLIDFLNKNNLFKKMRYYTVVRLNQNGYSPKEYGEVREMIKGGKYRKAMAFLMDTYYENDSLYEAISDNAVRLMPTEDFQLETDTVLKECDFKKGNATLKTILCQSEHEGVEDYYLAVGLTEQQLLQFMTEEDF